LKRVAQALFGQDDALVAHQPKILVEAWRAVGILQHEEPAIHLGTCRDRGEPGAERQIMRRAVVGEATELDPGIADAPVVAVHQQVPGHLLAVVAVGFEPRGLKLRIEQEGQGQRQHLGLTGTIVAA
jgi:hypothetical protein